MATRYYDRFRNRIMFPLFDSSSRIVGFSGRIFEVPTRSSVGTPTSPTAPSESVGAKYINTPQTILYDKSRILYGFERAKNAIRKENACVLVEGQMDLIMCHQAGITNAVAVSGTALTPHHLNSISRLTTNLVSAFDMDEAGQMATKRGVDLALQEGFEVKIAAIPFGKDPADVARENPGALKDAFKNAKPIISFFLGSLKNKFSDARTLKQEVAKSVLPYVALIRSPMDASHWVSVIAASINMKEEPIWEEVKKLARHNSRRETRLEKNPAGAFPQTKKRRELLEERLLGIALWKGGEHLIAIQEAAEYFSEPKRALLEEIAEKKENADFAKLAFEAELLYSGMENIALEIKSLVSELKRESIRERLELVASCVRQAEESADKEKLPQYLDEFKKLSIELAKFNSYPKIRASPKPNSWHLTEEKQND